MKVKSSALFGLMVVICSISGFSLLRRLTQEVDEWRPSNLYSSTNITRRSTFSAVSSAPASYTEAVATIASGSESLFRHSGATLYAPAMSMPSASISMGPSSGGGLYTTSSAELRSFGGGGNGGGGSMSGGSAKSSGSSVVSAGGLGVSVPSTSLYAYSNNRSNSAASDVISSVSGDIAMVTPDAYAGIGNTTGSRGMSGRKNVPGIGVDEWTGWLDGEWEGGSDEITWNMLRDLYVRMTGDTDFSNEELWNSFLAWFEGKQSDDSFKWHWMPISDAVPFVLFLCIAYAFMIYRKIKLTKKSEN